MADPENLTLQVRKTDSRNCPLDYEINGDAPFLWEELATLLVDPSVMSIHMERPVATFNAQSQIKG